MSDIRTKLANSCRYYSKTPYIFCKDIPQYKEGNKFYKLVKVKTSFVLITEDYNWTLMDIS